MSRMFDSNLETHDKHSTAIKKICSILGDHFNINKFYYGKVFNSGRFIGFDSNLDFIEQFSTTELFLEFPFHCHPKYHQPGVQIINLAENLGLINADVTKNCMLKFDANLWLRFVTKTGSSLEEFGFHSAQFDQKQSIFLFNQVPQLDLLMKFFQETNPTLFSSLEEVPVDLLSVIGSDFFENRIQRSDPHYIARQNFLKQLGIPTEPDLSCTELETLGLLISGYTAAQIAKQVYRSKRTIEHRIENMKSKLSCSSKQELIQKAHSIFK